MNVNKQNIPYDQTGFYTDIVLDYLQQNAKLKDFYEFAPTKENLEQVIKSRQNFATDRNLLTQVLLAQYENIETTEKVKQNINLLKADETFTITTAHQPNIFTGPLYFIYKILHAVKLAAYCKDQFPQYNFVPVYYMGSEDADMDELGHIFLNNEKLEWTTNQTGAFGRMKVDDDLIQLIKRIESEIGVLPHANEIIVAIKNFYTKEETIQNATLKFVNFLFGKYGLIVLIPDSANLKSVSVNVFKDELLHQHSSKMVEATSQKLLDVGYKAQAHGRDINLFYLKDDGQRLRIEKENDKWNIVDSDLSFDESELIQEVENHPERFSPNVILRGLFQETILPNIIFIGGGGELAYWLQLKNIFNHYAVPYPMLVLRNSFLIINKKQVEKTNKLGFEINDIFKNGLYLKSKWVTNHSDNDVSVIKAMNDIQSLFEQLSQQSIPIDITLKGHVYAIQKQLEKKIVELGKKFLRAEKRNHTDAMRQIDTLKTQLFPNNNLQERVDNIIPYYAKYGSSLIDLLYNESCTLEQEFVVLTEV